MKMYVTDRLGRRFPPRSPFLCGVAWRRRREGVSPDGGERAGVLVDGWLAVVVDSCVSAAAGRRLNSCDLLPSLLRGHIRLHRVKRAHWRRPRTENSNRAFFSSRRAERIAGRRGRRGTDKKSKGGPARRRTPPGAAAGVAAAAGFAGAAGGASGRRRLPVTSMIIHRGDQGDPRPWGLGRPRTTFIIAGTGSAFSSVPEGLPRLLLAPRPPWHRPPRPPAAWR
ncbi:uncharacterized protein LOC127748822 [Frankliniella occidentalis]|uniref:Uncharacterized protein LOC127748822 n=1 Tax=Frankliniella occidentalis TaxID=133901 RepID=A0A9C6WV13_FRAOC|nr:uncharacterized protein LOC127748822 [Frankliniella occidentalis]